MAKNLKINVKNTQLAAALKGLKKPEKVKPKAPVVKKEAVQEEEASPPVVERRSATPASHAPPPAPVPGAPPPHRPAEPVLGPKLGPKPVTPERRHAPIPPLRPAPPGHRPPYTPHTARHAGPRPPYQGRPYQPRREGQGYAAGAPRPPHARPPFRPAGSAPPGFRRPPGGSASPPRFGAGSYPQQREFPPNKPSRHEEPARRKPSGLLKEREKSAKKPGFERSFDSRDRQGLRDEFDEGWKSRKGRSFKSRLIEEEVVVRPKTLSIRLPITVKDLAAEMKLKASQLLSNLFMKGVVLTLNDYLDDETVVQLLGHDFECEITIDTSQEERRKITDQTIKQEIEKTAADVLIARSPVITFMGHVDHGKTSLIDAIRKTNVAAGEAGAITQHIGAFKCHTAHGDLTILDTPGHEAFSAMRSRGAIVTDVVVLVVAGDEGLRAQTLEAIKQAKEAAVPIVVAINKSDKQNFNAQEVYRQLSEHELLPEAWGGQTITVNCSALTGEGIQSLLEMLALQTEVLELKANPQARARGCVIESEMHKGLGATATILVQNGTLRPGDAVVFADQWGRVKTMQDEWGKAVLEAGPSTPIKITGLSGLPAAGSDFIVVKDEKEAREVSEARAIHKQHAALKGKRAGFESVLEQKMQKQEKKTLYLILRADVQGSLEALKHSLEKVISSKVEISVVSAAVGEISESDIQLAGASKATIIGFHTQVEPRAESLIKELHVTVRLHDIIYHAVDDVKGIMVQLLDKIAQETDTGEVAIKAVFRSSQLGNIAGCQVEEGVVSRSNHARLVRDKEVIWKGTIASLKRGKEDVREVSKGQECGILLQGFNDFKVGDLLQTYDVTYLTPEL